MRRLLLISAFACLGLTAPVTAQFQGTFELQPPGCEQQGSCVLTFDLRYRHPKRMEWLAAANNKTDGASISPWAQPFIGEPFELVPGIPCGRNCVFRVVDRSAEEKSYLTRPAD